mmetsp:Transcript_78351/g.227338  ORF Transcript_78351/g.227338 Transcript_78351/m.227338 type:complete len:358 (-) Transcript_78351:88-1161(-)
MALTDGELSLPEGGFSLPGMVGELRDLGSKVDEHRIQYADRCLLKVIPEGDSCVSTRFPSKETAHADNEPMSARDFDFEPLSARGLALDTIVPEEDAPIDLVLSPRATTVASHSHLERWSDRDETLIIFDWDDTLCPTTHGHDNPSCGDTDKADLQAHEEVVGRLLTVASEVGHIRIVSMAGSGWIERTMDTMLPGLKPLMDKMDIPITLARENIKKRDKLEAFAEGREPSTYLKRRTMMKVVRKFYRTSVGTNAKERSWKNVLSIGDSNAEKLALQDIVLSRIQRDRKGRWKECRCKTVKLKSEPTLLELTAQLRKVSESLPALVTHDGDLDLEFDESDAQEAIPNSLVPAHIFDT